VVDRDIHTVRQDMADRLVVVEEVVAAFFDFRAYFLNLCLDLYLFEYEVALLEAAVLALSLELVQVLELLLDQVVWVSED
jgi:hypothetical protein